MKNKINNYVKKRSIYRFHVETHLLDFEINFLDNETHVYYFSNSERSVVAVK